MQKMKFDEYIIPYGEDGQTKLSDIIQEDDIYYIERVNKPIITKVAISKIARHFGFIETDVRINSIDYKSNTGESYSIISAVIYYKDPNKIERNEEKIFFGDGEASSANLDNKISGSYPISLAVKRAKARAVLSYIGLDMYSEEEAETFRRPLELTKEQIYDIGQAQIKPTLASSIKTKSGLLGFSKEELTAFVKNVVNSTSGGKTKLTDQITYSELSVDDLLNVYTSLEIYRTISPDDMNVYIGSLIQTKP